MIRLPNQKLNAEKLGTVLIWTLAIWYFYFISVHSAMSADTSTKVSKTIVEKAFSVTKNVAQVVKTDGKKGISYTSVVVFIRKSAHLLNFYILGFLYAMTAFRTNNKKLLNVFAVVCICGFLGAVIDECHQSFVPGRKAQISDVFIDFTGVLCGCITFLIGILVLKTKKYGRDK